MSGQPYISVVTPVYGCSESLPELYERLCDTLSQINESFEIIMVDDASPDGAWSTILALARKDPRVRGIRLSRNFGQHRAITAGLDVARGAWVVVMDCDLQDQPEEILKLYKKAREGYDVVWGQRLNRQDSMPKRLSSRLFHIVYNYMTQQDKDSSTANFSIISQRVAREARRFREQTRNFPFFVRWLGYRSTSVEILHASRPRGKSAYTLRKLLEMAIDTIVSQSNKPLRFSIKFGFLLSVLSILYGLYLIIRYLTWGVPVAGWTSVMVSIFFIGGLLFANMGILGLYIGKIFDEVKGRPLYVVEETTPPPKDTDE